MTKRLLVATRKGLFDFQRQNNGDWEITNRCFLGEPVSIVLRDPRDNTLYAALNLGHFGTKLHRSDDDGQQWQEVGVPSYKNIKSSDMNGSSDSEGPSLKQIWSLECGADGVLWAGTIPGGLFKSIDRGESWQLASKLWNDPLRNNWFGGGYDEPGIHSICVDPRNANRITIAVSCGGVWISEDGGDNWRISTTGMWADYTPPEQRNNSAVQDPHRMVQCQSNPEHFWVQHHNGIFRSTDGAANWTEVNAQPSSFGFAVVVHPGQAETAWFVPAIKDDQRYPVDAKLVVTRTRDGGKNFTTLDQGLPTRSSYDLVYRHGLDIDASGNYLAMGSTTGNLWISDCGGDSWNEISNYLPPIYALRFIG